MYYQVKIQNYLEDSVKISEGESIYDKKNDYYMYNEYDDWVTNL